LDKYTDNIIPYWKTETVEAMMAFRHKEGYAAGAGECVSLSSLYAAAMFIVGHIPLDEIYLIATPLHSQNFIAERDGVFTNNRRIVTKTMWYNGTELSAKARRAVENEKITIVSHLTGYIHTLYRKATIDPKAYGNFEQSLRAFLTTEFTFEIFTNFLRTKSEFWDCFQYRHMRNNKVCYIELRIIFSYEHSSKNKFTGDSRKSLFEEMDPRDFHFTPREGKIVINDFEDFLNQNHQLSFDEKAACFLGRILPEKCNRMRDMFDEMRNFIHTDPRLPGDDKEYVDTPRLQLSTQQSREEMMAHIEEMSQHNEIARLAKYTFRQMDGISWIPFAKAALERNPVCIEGLNGKPMDEAYQILARMPENSIYSGKRLAQPDEVWNFGLGDGLEKAFVLAAFIKSQKPDAAIVLEAKAEKVTVKFGNDRTYSFPSSKNLEKVMEFAGHDIREN
jgi:hypothetical protein